MRAINVVWMLTHPVQYFSPLFKELSQRNEINFTALYGCKYGLESVNDKFYGEEFYWDTDFSEGHKHIFCLNPQDKYSRSFHGIPAINLSELLNSLSPNILIINGYDTSYDWRGIIWAFKKNVPVIARPEFGIGKSEYPFWKRVLGIGVKNLFFRFIAGGLACSVYSEEQLKKYLPCKPIYRCPYLVDNELLNSYISSENISATRRQFNIPDNATILLFVGRLSLIKRMDDAIKLIALSIEKNANNSWHLLVVGDGPLKDSLKKLAINLKIQNNVHFVGFRNQKELPDIFIASDVVILPSARETWGMSVNEGMALGVPPVISDRCMVGPDLVIPGKTGEIFKFGNVDEFYLSVNKVLRNKKFYSTNAKRHVFENYNAKVAANGVVQCAIDLVKQ